MLKSIAVSKRPNRITPIQIVAFLIVVFTVSSLPTMCRADIIVESSPCCAVYQGDQQVWGYYQSSAEYYVDRSYHQNDGPNGYHQGYGEEGYGYHRSNLGDYQISEAYGRNEFWGDGYQDQRGFGDYSH